MTEIKGYMFITFILRCSGITDAIEDLWINLYSCGMDSV